MKWPWQKKRNLPSPEPVPPVDVEAVARTAAEAAAQQAMRQVAEMFRTSFPSSPMPGPPTPGMASAYGLYGLDYPIQYSTPQAPTRRPGSQVTTQTLRQLAATYDILRACIQHLKRELMAVPFEFVPRDAKDDSARTQGQIAEAKEFFGTQGGLGGIGTLRSEFEGEITEELCVIGAAALYYHPTRGGWPYEVLTVPADTIRPRVDAFGWPGPGEVVYEQWIQGILMEGFTREQMTYRGLATHKRVDSPYYWSPVEWLLHVINSALRADEWNRRWLSDGNVPDLLIGAPEAWTPDQIKQYAAYFDAILAGDSSQRQKAKLVPGGMKTVLQHSRKDQDFGDFELWLLRRTCAIMGVQPASIGFAGEQYKVSQQDSMESTSAFGAGVLLEYRKEQYEDIADRLGLDAIEARNVTAREEQATERATRNATLLAGVKTPNEARKEEGLEPMEGGDTLFIPSTLRPLEQVLEPPPPGLGGGPPSNLDDPNPDSAGQENAAQGVRAALAQWERKALNRLRQGKPAGCGFDSETLHPSLRAFIQGQLGDCTSPEAVRALFRNAQAMTPEEAVERTDWAARVAGELEALVGAGAP